MGESTKSYRGRKVIVLSRDASFARTAQGEHSTSQYYCLRVTSPYEAAAELLIESPVAIVVDLRCLTPGDLPLIEMARQKSLEILAIGSTPLGVTTTDLSGVRLAAREHVAEMLAQLTLTPLLDGSTPEAVKSASGEGPELSSLAQWIRKAPLGERNPAPVQTDVEAPKPADEPPKTPEPEPEPQPRAEDKPAVHPNDLLTREELAALLEDES